MAPAPLLSTSILHRCPVRRQSSAPTGVQRKRSRDVTTSRRFIPVSTTLPDEDLRSREFLKAPEHDAKVLASERKTHEKVLEAHTQRWQQSDHLEACKDADDVELMAQSELLDISTDVEWPGVSDDAPSPPAGSEGLCHARKHERLEVQNSKRQVSLPSESVMQSRDAPSLQRCKPDKAEMQSRRAKLEQARSSEKTAHRCQGLGQARSLQKQRLAAEERSLQFNAQMQQKLHQLLARNRSDTWP